VRSTVSERAPGSLSWQANVMAVGSALAELWREQNRARGYREVKTPILYDVELWKQSGHWDKFRDHMYFTQVEDRPMGLKPMNCPAHVQLYKAERRSYRDLPIRFAEQGLVHRHEPSGVLHGLLRVRHITQDDAHIFCRWDQVEAEVVGCLDLASVIYETFGLDVRAELSTRPEVRIGTDEMWDAAEAALEAALRLFPGHPELSFYRALALEERGRHREAAQLFEQLERALGAPGRPRDAALAAVADGPAFLAPDAEQLLLDARVQAALSRGRAGEIAGAARRMKGLFSANPRDEGVALGLLEAFDRAGRVAAAVALLDNAARKHPDAPSLLYARALALDRAKRVPEALTAMRKVLAVAPAHAGALNYVGYVTTEQGGDLREAEGLLRRAVELRPDDGAVADSLGFCLLKEGRVEAALEELRRAERLAPGDPVILGHLGDALLAAGRREDAAETFRRALARLVRAPRGGRDRHARERAAGEQEARSPEPGDARVRAELEEKLRSLTAR